MAVLAQLATESTRPRTRRNLQVQHRKYLRTWLRNLLSSSAHIEYLKAFAIKAAAAVRSRLLHLYNALPCAVFVGPTVSYLLRLRSFHNYTGEARQQYQLYRSQPRI